MNKTFLRSLALFTVTVLLVLSSVLTINVIFDPLWYFNGNTVTKRNFGFNERLTKINQLIKKKDTVDCLIFGSSRATILPAANIDANKCFNLAFSAGRINEFSDYADYANSFLNLSISTSIIAVEPQNYFSSLSTNIPRFIKKRSYPDSFWQSYLTVDALVYSLRLFAGLSPLEREFDENFSVFINTTAKFNPNKPLVQTVEGKVLSGVNDKYHELLLAIGAEKNIFYIPPLSVWHMEDMRKKGILNSYLQSIYQLVQTGSQVIDFSVANDVTHTVENTYDGSHFSVEVNELIAKRIALALNNENQKIKNDFGVIINNLSMAEYIQLHNERLSYFINIDGGGLASIHLKELD